MKVDLYYAGEAPTSTNGVEVIRFICNGNTYEIRSRISVDGFQLQLCEPLGNIITIIPIGSNTIIAAGKERP